MKDAIEAARRHEQRTSELASAVHDAQEQYDLYRAKTFGPRLTSFSRLRELKSARDLAEARLRRAQAALGEQGDSDLERPIPECDPFDPRLD
jgi:hypothetical protein